MNEMQWILLAFALVVVVAIYFVSQKRASRHPKPREKTPRAGLDLKKHWSKVGFGSAADDTLPSINPQSDVQPVTQSASSNNPQPQSPLSSKAAASMPTKPIATAAAEHDAFEYLQAKLALEAEMERQQDFAAAAYANQNLAEEPKHKVIEIDDMFPADETYYPKEVRDGRHHSAEAPSQLEVPLDNSEPETFAILVLSIADEFSIKAIDQVLKTNGLTFNADAGIFVKKVNNKTVLRVANIFEPGVFPAEWEEGASTAGIAIILQLPTHIKAPRAMDELILTARRVSQSLRGRMYDMERRMIRETDLQAMRERALDYETTRM
jgi:cell division protein ZipA